MPSRSSPPVCHTAHATGHQILVPCPGNAANPRDIRSSLPQLGPAQVESRFTTMAIAGRNASRCDESAVGCRVNLYTPPRGSHMHRLSPAPVRAHNNVNSRRIGVSRSKFSRLWSSESTGVRPTRTSVSLRTSGDWSSATAGRSPLSRARRFVGFRLWGPTGELDPPLALGENRDVRLLRQALIEGREFRHAWFACSCCHLKSSAAEGSLRGRIIGRRCTAKSLGHRRLGSDSDRRPLIQISLPATWSRNIWRHTHSRRGWG